jgi:hypothetical protein
LNDLIERKIYLTKGEVDGGKWKGIVKKHFGVEYKDKSCTWDSSNEPDGTISVTATVKKGAIAPWRKGPMGFTMKVWTLIEKILAFGGVRTLYLYGPPGVGKTYAAYHYGRIGHGFYACTLTDETSAAELRGHFIFKGGDAIWHDGPFVRAMREGKRLVINEITNASSDVLALLFPILESFETACLTLPNGETIKPAEGFHVIATDNRSPDLLPEALQDRFMAYVEVKDTHPSALDGIDDDLKSVAKQTIGEGDRLISARGWHSLNVLRKEFGTDDACGLAFGLTRGRRVCDALKLALEERALKEENKRRKADERVRKSEELAERVAEEDAAEEEATRG